MSAKRKADPADVLVNKLNVGLAKHKRLLASWSGLAPPSSSAGSAVESNDGDDDDFKDEALGYEQLGIGGKIPKDIQDGSFTRRTLTSNDKLLQQLMGKKAAKAHIAARQNPGEAGKPKKFEPAPKPESEDEEEGRAATFKSKRRKIARTPKVEEDDESNSMQAEGAEIPPRPAGIEGDAETTPAAKAAPKDGSHAEEPPTKSKRKGGSYLDELLAERSKKQKNKKKKQEAKA